MADNFNLNSIINQLVTDLTTGGGDRGAGKPAPNYLDLADLLFGGLGQDSVPFTKPAAPKAGPRESQAPKRPSPKSETRKVHTPLALFRVAGSDDLTVQIEVPGVDLEDLTLALTEGELTVTGARKAPQDERAGYLLNEFQEGAIDLAIHVADHVTAGDLEASLKNGILTVVVKGEFKEPAKPSDTITIVNG